MQEPPNEVEGLQALLRELLAEVARLKAENARLKDLSL